MNHRLSYLFSLGLWVALLTSTIFFVSCGSISNPLGGGSGGGTSTTTSSNTFSLVYKVITTVPQCVDCHSPPSGSGTTGGSELNFSTQALAYSTLTSKKIKGASSSGVCNTVAIVDSTGVITKSGLAAVLFSEYNTTNNFAGVTGCKPYTAHHTDLTISETEKSNILGWIQNGAQNNFE